MRTRVVVHQTPAGGGVVQFTDDHGVERAAAEILHGNSFAAGAARLPIGAEITVNHVAVTGTVAFTGSVGAGIHCQIGTQVKRAAAGRRR